MAAHYREQFPDRGVRECPKCGSIVGRFVYSVDHDTHPYYRPGGPWGPGEGMYCTARGEHLHWRCECDFVGAAEPVLP